MMSPEQIRRKAQQLYPQILRSWVRGEPELFPYILRGNLQPAADLQQAIQEIRRLRENSKEQRGFGYSITWREINSRRFGRNDFPVRISFDTRDDLLKLIGRQEEFARFQMAAERIGQVAPQLTTWLSEHPELLLPVMDELDGLLEVIDFLQRHPRPQLYVRQLPLSVDTKFIERHQSLLRAWLDLTLPAHAIRADAEHFERRYGLRYAEPHIMLRCLDDGVRVQLGLPCSELSLPLSILAVTNVQLERVWVVENKINLLTLPQQTNALAVGGLGRGVTLLRYCRWLERVRIIYWGDMDVEGFEILSSLRMLFPHTESFLMDASALAQWQSLCVTGTDRCPTLPPLLSETEQAAFIECRDRRLRLEQERLPQSAVERAVHKIVPE